MGAPPSVCKHAHTHTHKESDRHAGESSSSSGLLSQAFKQKSRKCFSSQDCSVLTAGSAFHKVNITCSPATSASVTNCLKLLTEQLHNSVCKETTQLGGLSALFAKSAIRAKEWVKEPRGAGEREGVCQRAFICGMVMTLFLQPLSKLSTSCLLRACSHTCPCD